jgi:TPR repeat protein
VVLLLILTFASFVTFSLLHRAFEAIDFDESWGLQLQQALALIGPCNSCIAVGSSYYNSSPNIITQTPTLINYTKAAQWFSRALKRGCPHALYPLALSLYNAQPVLPASPHSSNEKQQSLGHACSAMIECADAGYLECSALLADMLFRGSRGCPQDFSGAGQRAVVASKGGSVNGACTLASMIADGRAFTRRPEEALKWAHVCRMHGGGDKAAALVQHLLEEVHAEQDEAARAFAQDWRKQHRVDYVI